ncbi:MAG: transcription elongation factor GreA [Bulleidia sp.]|nr:transcription elongation factor GreA [Bulleidia sp.]
MEEKIQLTEEGLKKLQERYDYLVHVEREKNKEELAEARSLGDLSENADYDAAREKQTQIEQEIQELEYKIQPGNYEIIKKVSGRTKTVYNGSTVVLKFSDTGEEMTYALCGSDEADPLNGKLSLDSLLAKSIMGHKVGDVVDIDAKIPYSVTIVKTK